MNKQEFLYELRLALKGLPQGEIEERIGFYGEIIDDRIEEGLSEEDAVSGLGSVKGIVSQIMAEIPLSRLVKEKVKPSRALRTWEIVLLILGSPIWLSLLIALFAVIISLYAVIWSLIISLWAMVASFFACSVGGIFVFVASLIRGSFVSGFAMLGGGLICAALGILALLGCDKVTRAILKATKSILVWMKSCFIKKETAK